MQRSFFRGEKVDEFGGYRGNRFYIVPQTGVGGAHQFAAQCSPGRLSVPQDEKGARIAESHVGGDVAEESRTVESEADEHIARSTSGVGDAAAVGAINGQQKAESSRAGSVARDLQKYRTAVAMFGRLPQDFVDPAISDRWRVAAEAGNADGQFIYAISIIGNDPSQAATWMKKAAAQSHVEAQCKLAVMMSSGVGVPEDSEAAVRILRRLADKGHPRSQYNLGAIYDRGEGVARDVRAAAQWNLRAAKQGFVMAEFNMGSYYENGDGVPKDYSKAMHWYRVAAGKGYAKAQNRIGEMYEHGRGVEQDYGVAAQWYLAAANQGEPTAQNNLGELYAAGNGVAKNRQVAIEYFGLAARQGNIDARANLLGIGADAAGAIADALEASIESAKNP